MADLVGLSMVREMGALMTGIVLAGRKEVWRGEGVEVLARHGDAVVAVRQGSILGISFHPELMGDTTLHRLLLRDAARHPAQHG